MRRRTAAFLFVLLLTLTWNVLALATETFSGKVVGISDGDTISVLRDGRAVKVRLAGIDCPEKGQPFGTKAKQFTSDLAFGQQVTVRTQDTDRYGRLVGSVILPDGRNLNQEIVGAGFAWWYKQYAPNDRTLSSLETEARGAKRGLWSEKNPEPPWEWRSEKRGGSNRPRSTETHPSGPLHGNVKSHVFHRLGCRYYDCNDCTTIFKDREDAIQAGYRPCGLCNP